VRAVTRRLRPVAKVLLLLFIAWVGVGVLTVSIIEVGCRGGPGPRGSPARPPERTRLTADLPEYARPEDDTYLSYPERYIEWRNSTRISCSFGRSTSSHFSSTSRGCGERLTCGDRTSRVRWSASSS